MCRGDCLRFDCAAEKKENGAGCRGEAAGRGGRRMKGRAAAMTAPLAIVDGNLVAGEVTVLDTLLPESQEPTANLPESQEPTANHSSERISPSQPEEMPPRVPPSAVVCGDIPPRLWAAFVYHKKENEAPTTAAKKKAKAKQRQNKKDDDLIILDKDLLNPKGKKKNDDGEVANGKKKKG